MGSWYTILSAQDTRAITCSILAIGVQILAQLLSSREWHDIGNGNAHPYQAVLNVLYSLCASLHDRCCHRRLACMLGCRSSHNLLGQFSALRPFLRREINFTQDNVPMISANLTKLLIYKSSPRAWSYHCIEPVKIR